MVTIPNGSTSGHRRTVLGPLLFVLYSNDPSDSITSEVGLFADDCVMFRSIQSNFDAEKLQSDLTPYPLCKISGK